LASGSSLAGWHQQEKALMPRRREFPILFCFLIGNSLLRVTFLIKSVDTIIIAPYLSFVKGIWPFGVVKINIYLSFGQ
jgi:hypothetical protein